MCGIGGEIRRRSGARASLEDVAPMMRRQTHRGPDGGGSWTSLNGEAILAHRRLTILDLSEASAQPFVIPEVPIAITYNGEVYNYIELREELVRLGHRFRSSGDTEVLLRGYLQWGSEVLHRLNGMFAFAIYDGRDQSLFLARDSMGQKPLLYFQDREGLAFASEMSALLQHPRCPRVLSKLNAQRFLAFDFVPGTETIIDGIQRLAPGHFIVFHNGKGLSESQAYFQYPSPSRQPRGLPKKDDLDRVEKILERAVVRHLRSDVPVGIYLSGGIDSSLIASFAARLLGPNQLNSFTVRFDERSYNEADIAADTSRRLQTKHHELFVRGEDFARQVERLTVALDEPLADPGYLAISQVAQFASRSVKVVLSGDGGDELFYGYEPFMKWSAAKLLDRVPRPVAELLLKPLFEVPRAQYGYMGFAYKALTFLRAHHRPDQLKNISWSGGFQPQELQRLLGTSAVSDADLYRSLWKIHSRSESSRLTLDDLGREYRESYLPGAICAHTDKANMLYSLEARSPWLDSEVVALSAQTPAHWKVRGSGQGKWLLRQILARRLPGSHVATAKKRGFTVPLAIWLKRDLKDWAEGLLFSRRAFAGLDVDPSEVLKIWKRHQDGQANEYKKLWALIVLECWRTAHLDSGGPQVSAPQASWMTSSMPEK